VLQLARQWVLPFAGPRQLASTLGLSRFLGGWRRSRGISGAPDRPAAGGGRDPSRVTRFDDLRDFHQAAWLGRLVAKARPSMHVDIGSHVPDVGVLSGFVPVIYVGGRPPHVHLAGLAPVAGDIACLPLPDKSAVSVSSLCAIGHDGDPERAVKALGELQRVVGYRGSLYLSAPVGRERTNSGGQRIFAPETILAAVPHLRLRRFNYVGDNGELHADAPLDEAAKLKHGCGLFEFERG
jgi:hypothetical protein